MIAYSGKAAGDCGGTTPSCLVYVNLVISDLGHVGKDWASAFVNCDETDGNAVKCGSDFMSFGKMMAKAIYNGQKAAKYCAVTEEVVKAKAVVVADPDDEDKVDSKGGFETGDEEITPFETTTL